MKIFCERCFEQYEQEEINLSKYFDCIFCTPCEKEYERSLNSFNINFLNNQPERSKREDLIDNEDATESWP